MAGRQFGLGRDQVACAPLLPSDLSSDVISKTLIARQSLVGFHSTHLLI